MKLTFALLLIGLCLWPGYARGEYDLDIEQVIDGAYRQDSLTRAEVGAMSIRAESYVRKLNGDGEVEEEKKFIKEYYFKDSLFKEVYLEYSLDGQLQDEEQLQKQIEEAAERRRKGRNRDASIRPLTPFYPENREHYKFSMPGVEIQHGCVSYHIVADCMADDENLMEGDYWFEANALNLVYAEFHPAKLPSKIKQLDMTMSLAPVEAGYWLPVGFHLIGRGKVLIFIKFYFEVEEKYGIPEIKLDLPDSFFKEDDDER
jgi:hypothetical protein